MYIAYFKFNPFDDETAFLTKPRKGNLHDAYAQDEEKAARFKTSKEALSALSKRREQDGIFTPWADSSCRGLINVGYAREVD